MDMLAAIAWIWLWTQGYVHILAWLDHAFLLAHFRNVLYHTISLLLWCTRLPMTARLSLWLCIEVIFNISPFMLGCHMLVLLVLAYVPAGSHGGKERASAA